MTAPVPTAESTSPQTAPSVGGDAPWWRPTGTRVLQVAAALVALQLLVRGVVAARGYYYWDDLILTGRAGTMSLLSPEFLLYDHDGHFMPAAFLVAGIANTLAPYQWALPALILVILQALASLAVLRLLVVLLGRRPSLLIPLALYLFSPLTLPAFAWWAAGLNALPMQIGLAAVAADAVLLCRTGRARYAWSALAVFVASLLFFEKAVLVPVVAFAVVALAYRVDGHRKPLRAALVRGRRLWAWSAVVVAGWAAVYALVVTPSPGERTPEMTVELIRHSNYRGLFPTLLGGPWRWDRWPPSPPWAVPPEALVVVAALAVLACVAGTLAWKRRVGWVWIATAAYVLASETAMVIARSSPDTTYELGQTLRYLTDSAVVVAIALALVLRAPTRDRWSGRRSGPRTAGVVSVLVAAFVASSLWSTATFVARWEDNPTVDYLARAKASLAANADAPMLDQPVSIWVLLPVAYPHNMAGSVFAALPDRPEFAPSTPVLRKMDDSGDIVDAQVSWVRAIGEGPVPGCGYRVTDATTVLPLDGPLAGWEWAVQLNYLASRDGEIEVGLAEGEPVTVPVRAGLNTAYVSLDGGGPGVRVRTLDPELSLCVGVGPVGAVVPKP
ncbi:hypothetical protein [Rhodococcus kronopolitis]|uniref:Uncharacterized protein n=1 Tax=Rhodococcus kronopolitis TaxID=1460226 RepID=A0ABV9FP52_9NOCA